MKRTMLYCWSCKNDVKSVDKTGRCKKCAKKAEELTTNTPKG